MADISPTTRGFHGGEISPEMVLDLDNSQVVNGLKLCRNFLIAPHGPAFKRPGTDLVIGSEFIFDFIGAPVEAPIATDDGLLRYDRFRGFLVPFSFNEQESFVLWVSGNFSPSAYDAPVVTIFDHDGPIAPPTIAPYNAGTAYQPGDVVSGNGQRWFAHVATTGHAPPTIAGQANAYWVWEGSNFGNSYPIPLPVYLGGGSGGTWGSMNFIDRSIYNQVRYSQNYDVVTLTHPTFPTFEICRGAGGRWFTRFADFTAPLSPPASAPVATRNNQAGSSYSPAGVKGYYYKVTALGVGPMDESVPTGASTVLIADLYTTGYFNVVSFLRAAGAVGYNIYKEDNGIFGYIGYVKDAGSGSTQTFSDYNVAPDLALVPPTYRIPFATVPGADIEAPSASAQWQQRQVFVGTPDEPLGVWISRPGTQHNNAYSLPSRDDDAINTRLDAAQFSRFKSLVALRQQLIAFTAQGVHSINFAGSAGLTPASISARIISSTGANNTQPALADTSVLYGSFGQHHINELIYTMEQADLDTRDLSIKAGHLFEGEIIISMAFARTPYPTLWCVTYSGKLLALTYNRRLNVAAWSQHNSNAAESNDVMENLPAVEDGDEEAQYNLIDTFQSVCVIPINGVDVPHFIVRRVMFYTLLDKPVASYRLERLSNFATKPVQVDVDFPRPVSQTSYVDGAYTFSTTGAPFITISVPTLFGRTVQVVADNIDQGDFLVPGSAAITLPAPAYYVKVGLPIAAQLETLPFGNSEGEAQNQMKNVTAVTARVISSGAFEAGTQEDYMTEAKWRTDEPYGDPPRLRTDTVDLTIGPEWTSEGSVIIRQNRPLPLILASLTLDVSLGG